MDSSASLSTILSSAVISGLIAALVSIRTSERNIQIQNVTQERAKWRDKIRVAADKGLKAIRRKDQASLHESRLEFSLNLNPHDIEDQSIIECLCIERDPQKNEALAVEFTTRVSLLLKHDWERAKNEARPFIFQESVPSRTPFDAYVKQQAGEAVDTNVLPAASDFRTQLPIALRYVGKQYLNGFGAGFALLILNLVNPNSGFAIFCNELLTTIHPDAIFIGLMALSAYMLTRGTKGFFTRMCRSWFDFIQQFITLGFGAFIPLKIEIYLSAVVGSHYEIPPTVNDLILFGTLGFGSLLSGMLWSGKDLPFSHPKISRTVAGTLMFFSFLFLAITFFKKGNTWSEFFFEGKSAAAYFHIEH